MLFVSPDFYTRTREAGTSVTQTEGKCIGIFLLRDVPWWRQTQALLFLCEGTFIETGFYSITVHCLIIFKAGGLNFLGTCDKTHAKLLMIFMMFFFCRREQLSTNLWRHLCYVLEAEGTFWILKVDQTEKNVFCTTLPLYSLLSKRNEKLKATGQREALTCIYVPLARGCNFYALKSHFTTEIKK